MTDSNGTFNAYITDGGPYSNTNVLYRFNPDVRSWTLHTNCLLPSGGGA